MSNKHDGSVTISTGLDNSQIPRDARVMAMKLAAEFRAAGNSAAESFKKAWEQVKLKYPEIEGTPEQLVMGVPLEDIEIPEKAQARAMELVAEFFEMGDDAAQAFQKAWEQVKIEFPEIQGEQGKPGEGKTNSHEATVAAQAAREAMEQTANAAQRTTDGMNAVSDGAKNTAQSAKQTAEAAQGAAQTAGTAGQASAQAAESAAQSARTASEGIRESAGEVQQMTGEVEEQHRRIQEILADTHRTASSKAMAIAHIYKQQGIDMSEAMKKAWNTVRSASASGSAKAGEYIRKNMGGAVTEVTGKLGGLKGVLKTLVPSITAVFSVAAVVQFGKKASAAARELDDALVGLKSTLDNMGRSFTAAQGFIKEYTSDGLISEANAVAAYKNLAKRGYSDSQIRKVMLGLKDASAYGRQASMTMGEAVQSATEGLKNENSILVDNAGVTKNVAKMWEDYAKSIGTTAANLTKEQKIQAEVNGILEETRFQTGDAAKVAENLSGQLQQTSFRLNELMRAVGNIINPILRAFIPAFNAAISVLTRFANTVAAVVGMIFGSAHASENAGEMASEGYDAAAESAENFGDAATAAGKAAERSLAGFDQITKLSDHSGGGGGGSTVLDSLETEQLTVSVAPLEDTLTPQLEKMLDSVRGKVEEFTALFEPSTVAWKEAFKSLGPVFEDTGKRIGTAWTKLKDEKLAPLGSFLINEFVPNVTNAFSVNLAPVFSDVMSTAANVFALDFENMALLVGEYCLYLEDGYRQVETVFRDMCTGISTAWKEHGGSLMAGFQEFREGMWEIWWDIYDNVISPVVTKLAETFSRLWDNNLRPLWNQIMSFVLSVGDNVFALWNEALKPFLDWVISVQGPHIVQWIRKTIEEFSAALAYISFMVENAIQILDGVITFLTGIFTGDWERAWKGIKDIFGGVWDQTKATLKIAINGCIEMVNSMISGIYSGIRKVVNGLGGVAEAAGKIVGKEWGFSMPEKPPAIPYLAQGAVLPPNKPFLAMVGDQRNGTNVEAPLSTIQEAVAIVMEDMMESNMAGHEATVSVLRELLAAVRGIHIGDDDVAAAVRRSQIRRTVMKGGGYAL